MLQCYLDSVGEDLEGGVVLHELEDPEDADCAENGYSLEDVAGPRVAYRLRRQTPI